MAPRESCSGGLGLDRRARRWTRVLRARIEGIDDEAYEIAAETEKREILAEQLRLLYVGLTRARYAAWLYAASSIWYGEKSALSWLLHRQPDGKVSDPRRRCDRRRVRTSRKAAPRAIVRDPSPDIVSRALQFPADARRRTIRCAKRAASLRRDWWVHSFSQLAREESGTEPDAIDAQGAEDEPAEIALEPIRVAVCRRALRQCAARRARNDRLRALARLAERSRRRPAKKTRCVARSVRTAMSMTTSRAACAAGGAGARHGQCAIARRRCASPTSRRADRRAEIEFHFALSPVSVERLIELLHRHDVLRDRDGFGTRERLEGLMTGRIDLVYLHADRIYLSTTRAIASPTIRPKVSRARCATANTTCNTSSTRLRCIAGSIPARRLRLRRAFRRRALSLLPRPRSVARRRSPACSSRGRRAH